jgi:ferritin-like protein
VNRGRFLAGGAAAVLVPTTLVPLARADVSEDDVAYANFAIACEYLMADYYARLLRAGLVHGSVRSGATVACRNEAEHLKGFATLLTDAGQSVPVADDFAFAWPAKTFRSLGAAAEAGTTIEGAVLGAYISAAVSISAESYRSLFARALADEARHLAVLTWVASGKPVGNSFPPALDLEQATSLVESYLG